MQGWRAPAAFPAHDGLWAVLLLAGDIESGRTMRYASRHRRFKDPTTGQSVALGDARILAWREAFTGSAESYASTSPQPMPRLSGRGGAIFAVAFVLGAIVGASLWTNSGDVGDIALWAAVFGVTGLLAMHILQRVIVKRLAP